MLKKILLILTVIVLAAVIIEAALLIHLKSEKTSYKNYWQNLPQTGDFTYVALGDSTAQGLGASQPKYAYVGLIAAKVSSATNKSVRVVNLSVSGAKISDVINNQIPKLKDYRPELVTIEIGANDVAGKYDHQKFASDFERLIKLLPKNTYVSNMPYFGGIIRHEAEALDASDTIASLTKKYNQNLVDLQSITKEHNSVLNYAPDFFHPSNRAYKLWAEAFWQAIEPNLK